MAKSHMKEWMLIIDEVPLRGSSNMAIDDYLFQSLSDEPQTYIRFYQWERPAVSLGYSQSIQNVVDVEFCRKREVDIVRRMTGGKLVLHHKEVTYSLCSSDSKTFTPTLLDSYRLISKALMCGLQKMGLDPYLAGAPPDFYKRSNLPCFSFPARNEIEVERKKIIGSAQKRVGTKFIQHGSIPLEEDAGLLKSVSRLKEKAAVRMISLSQALGRKVSFDWAVKHLKAGFSEYFKIDLKPKIFGAHEKEVIFQIQEQKYANKDWTRIPY